MKLKFSLRNFLVTAATLAVSSMPLHAATIDLNLTSNNSGAITLDAGNNTFSFSGFSVQYLIVAGGGGGGAGIGTAGGGGGGGAGGLLEGQNLPIGGAQTIVVGRGGAGGTGNNATGGTNAGQAGIDSTAFSLTAKGGGFGGRFDSGGGDGGSGGGAAARGSGGMPGGSGTSGQGFDGGSWTASGAGASSGGGAGGAGINGTGTVGRNGGAAVTRNITGNDVVYAAGGAGGGSTGGGTSATGGNGGFGATVGSNAAANTGGGGGGGGTSSGGNSGGNGGSGIVVVRYSGSQVLAGGIVSTVGSDTVHTFLYDGIGNNTSHTLDLHSATVAGNISGTGNLIWNKAGTLTLTGTSAYDGSTTVNTGMLAILGSVQTSNLSFLDDGVINLGSSGQLFVLASNYSLTDAQNDITAGNIFGDQALFVSTATIGSDDYIFFNAIPEPTTALLGGIGMLCLLRRRR